MYLHENTLLTLTQGHTNFSPEPSTSMLSLRLLLPTVWEEMHLEENILFDLDLGVKVTQNISWYPLHHVTYALG